MSLLCGMGPGDFSSKLGGSIFRVNGQIFQLSTVGREDSFDDDDEREGNEREFELVGMELDSQRRWQRASYDPDAESVVVDLSFPTVGYVNYKAGAVYMARDAQRQYKMGYNHRVVKVSDRFDYERRALGIAISDDVVSNPQFVSRMFDRFFFTYTQAISAIRNRTRLGAAISPQVYIGLSGEYNHPVICYKDKVVGYVDGLTNYLFPDAAYVGTLLPSYTIKQETTDVAIRTEWN